MFVMEAPRRKIMAAVWDHIRKITTEEMGPYRVPWLPKALTTQNAIYFAASNRMVPAAAPTAAIFQGTKMFGTILYTQVNTTKVVIGPTTMDSKRNVVDPICSINRLDSDKSSVISKLALSNPLKTIDDKKTVAKNPKNINSLMANLTSGLCLLPNIRLTARCVALINPVAPHNIAIPEITLAIGRPSISGTIRGSRNSLDTGKYTSIIDIRYLLRVVPSTKLLAARINTDKKGINDKSVK